MEKLKILFTGPDISNVTDRMIYKGIRELLNILPGFEYVSTYRPISESKVYQPEEFQTGLIFDLIIICGTPWLWENFEQSTKYQNLLNMFKAHPFAKKLFFGAGSCYLIDEKGDPQEECLQLTDQAKEAIRNIFGGPLTTVVVRDHVIQMQLERCRIPTKLLPCPAFYAISRLNYKPKHATLIFYDPTGGLSKCDWQSEPKVHAYFDRLCNFAKDFNAHIFAVTDWEIRRAKKLGLNCEVIRSTKHVEEILSRTSVLLSGRVHIAVPAASLDIPSELMQIDSRHFTLHDFVWEGSWNAKTYHYYLIEYLSWLQNYFLQINSN